MDGLDLIAPPDRDAVLDDIAGRYHAAGGLGIEVLNLIGGQADGLLDRLPTSVRGRLEDATFAALQHAMTAADASRSAVPDQKSWLNQTVGAAMGAVGGMGGLPTALAELPVTTTLLLRIIQGVAADHGFDPKSDGVKFDCVRVFASAGPLEHDDGADLGFISARLTLTGPAIQALMRRVAPQLAVVLGQKLAAQTVPILGAAAGAATNYAYVSYYRDMAHIHFSLRKLAIDADEPLEALIEDLRVRLAARR